MQMQTTFLHRLLSRPPSLFAPATSYGWVNKVFPYTYRPGVIRRRWEEFQKVLVSLILSGGVRRGLCLGFQEYSGFGGGLYDDDSLSATNIYEESIRFKHSDFGCSMNGCEVLRSHSEIDLGGKMEEQQPVEYQYC